jgi:hypothetical protein
VDVVGAAAVIVCDVTYLCRSFFHSTLFFCIEWPTPLCFVRFLTPFYSNAKCDFLQFPPNSYFTSHFHQLVIVLYSHAACGFLHARGNTFSTVPDAQQFCVQADAKVCFPGDFDSKVPYNDIDTACGTKGSMPERIPKYDFVQYACGFNHGAQIYKT